MANKLYPEGAIQGIADAIRSLNGGTNTYKVSQMAAAISALPTGSGDADELAAIFDRTISGTYTTSTTEINQLYAFASCTALSSINLPNCSFIGTSAFYSCTGLTTISCPKVKALSNYCFYGCWNLSSIKFDEMIITIPSNAFQSCYNLLSVNLIPASEPTLGVIPTGLANVNAFTSTPISTYTTSTGGVYGSIYVPASLVASYKAATNWVTYSARIVGV